MKVVFLTYVNRSGSTYLSNLLSASNDICVCLEGDILVRLFLESPRKAFRLDENGRAEILKLVQSDNKLKYWGIGNDILTILEDVDKNISAFLAFLLYYQQKQKPGASCILFKAERLANLFPKIQNCRESSVTFKYLSMIRDPRGVYESQKRTRIPGTDRFMSNNPVYTALTWNHYCGSIVRFRNQHDCFPVLFRDLLYHMDKTLSALSVYLDLSLTDISPKEGDLAARLPDSHRLIHPIVSENPDQEKINAWKINLNQEEISFIERKCHKYLCEFGFDPSSTKQHLTGNNFIMIYYTSLYQAIQLIRKTRFHFKRIFWLVK